MTNKSLRRKSLKKSLRKKKLRVSNKRNSSSRKKGGSSLSRQKLKAFVIPPWLSQRLHYLDKLNFFNSTKRLEIRKNGIQLIKELGITNKLSDDCGCLTNSDCDSDNCNPYKNQCDPLVSETIEKKNERRMNQVLLLLKDDKYNFLFDEDIGVFFDEINKELNSKMSDEHITIDSLADFIIAQRNNIKNATQDITREVIKQKLRQYYNIPDEEQNVPKVISKEELTQSSLFSEENMGAMKRKLGEKLPTIISKEYLITRIKNMTNIQDLNEIFVDNPNLTPDMSQLENINKNILTPEIMSQLENINKNIISRKCLFDSVTSGEKFPFGVLIPCILLTFDWNNFINKFSSIRYLLSPEELENIEELKSIDKVDFKSVKSSLVGGQKKIKEIK